jgi:hypothetical protein
VVPFVSADPTPASWDEDRLTGFRGHVKAQDIHDRERAKGQTAYNEELEQWERQRIAAIAEHKRQRKATSPLEGGPEDRADRAEKREYAVDAEKERLQYVRIKTKMSAQRRRNVAVTPEEELGLKTDRPRYDVTKRVLYGASGKYRPSTGGSSGGTNPNYSGPTPGGNLPPPPTFDDFGGGDGYIPPPVIPEYDDMPPVPPPPSGFEEGDFPPPPPDFNDFPPPPPDGF